MGNSQDKIIAQELWCELAEIGEILGVEDSRPHFCRVVKKELRRLISESNDLSRKNISKGSKLQAIKMCIAQGKVEPNRVVVTIGLTLANAIMAEPSDIDTRIEVKEAKEMIKILGSADKQNDGLLDVLKRWFYE